MEKEKFNAITKKQFTKLSRWYDSAPLRLLYFRKIYGKIIEIVSGKNNYLKPDYSFLDVACGTGEVIYRLAGKYPSVNFFGVDFTEAMVEVAAQKNYGFGNVKIIKADAAKLPFNDKTFDFILSSDALHHFSEPELAIKEMNRVVKDKGFLLIVDPSADGKIKRLMINFFGKLLETADRYYSQKDIETLLKKSGFEVESEFTYYFNNFVFAKKHN